MIEIVFHGTQRFESALSDYESAMLHAAGKALKAAGDEVVKEAKASFGGGGPASRTGALAGSIIVVGPEGPPEASSVRIGPSALPYARRVELGKHSPHSAGPHPYLRPGFKRAAERFVKVFAATWEATTRSAR